ncbi:MAG: flavin reductase family protein [Candidatus Ventricola sp.]|nr:flavin reductase family protein [Candidatus Ventricola sp.]MDY4855195.1 flavin reductase family protein [Candidatus Ventricola sp.]
MPNAFRAIGPTTLLAPVPAVMLSCRGTEPGFDRDNLITVAWTGIVNSDPPMLSVSIRPSRHSYAQIVQSGTFCLNLVSRDMCRAADFCGVRSGRDVDKFRETGLHARAVEGFDAPAIGEAPAFLCCRVTQRIPLGSHELFLCAIEQVYARDDLFDADGSLHLERADLVAYAHGEYHPLRPLAEGFFGYSVARPEVLARRLGQKRAGGKAPDKKGGKRR